LLVIVVVMGAVIITVVMKIAQKPLVGAITTTMEDITTTKLIRQPHHLRKSHPFMSFARSARVTTEL